MSKKKTDKHLQEKRGGNMDRENRDSRDTVLRVSTIYEDSTNIEYTVKLTRHFMLALMEEGRNVSEGSLKNFHIFLPQLQSWHKPRRQKQHHGVLMESQETRKRPANLPDGDSIPCGQGVPCTGMGLPVVTGLPIGNTPSGLTDQRAHYAPPEIQRL